jgi:hypothetical protein
MMYKHFSSYNFPQKELQRRWGKSQHNKKSNKEVNEHNIENNPREKSQEKTLL